MFGIAFIALVAFIVIFLYPLFQKKPTEVQHNARYDVQMKRLWTAAQTSMRDHKPLRAEKALLTILKFDERNAAAYNRLGILYAKEQKFDEAIECFEIAQSLDNNPSSLHNVGLIYLETGAYEKAAMAFEQAIELENSVPARYVALSKAREKLGQNKAAIDALEEAYKLDHSTNTLRQILAIYETMGDTEALAGITARIEKQIAETTKAERRRNTRTNRSAATRSAAKTTHNTTRTPARATRKAATPTVRPATKTAKSARSATPSTPPRKRPAPRRKQI